MAPPTSFVNLTQLAILALAVAYLFRVRVAPRLAWAFVGLALGVAAWESLAQNGYLMDAMVFRAAGRAVWSHEDPYASLRVLNPPTALPVFALLALIPAAVFGPVWKLAIVLGHAATSLVSGRLVGSDVKPKVETKSDDGARVPTDVVVVTAVVVMSVAARMSLAIGQLTFVTTLAIVSALLFHARGKPIAAGIALAVASIKITTMLPFLLLFLHRRDWKVWVALVVAGLALTFATVAPGDLLARLSSAMAAIKGGSAPGAMNDYTFANPYSVDLVSFGHAIYHLGLRDRSLINVCQLAATALLAFGVWWMCRDASGLSFVQQACLVACFSMCFLYHREYDSTILAIPLVYCLRQAVVVVAPWRYRFAAFAILGVLYLRIRLLGRFMGLAERGGPVARLVEVLVLPSATWLTLAALFLLASAMRRSAFPSSGTSSKARARSAQA
jgi:hypothetical protein